MAAKPDPGLPRAEIDLASTAAGGSSDSCFSVSVIWNLCSSGTRTHCSALLACPLSGRISCSRSFLLSFSNLSALSHQSAGAAVEMSCFVRSRHLRPSRGDHASARTDGLPLCSRSLASAPRLCLLPRRRSERLDRLLDVPSRSQLSLASERRLSNPAVEDLNL